MIFLDAKCSLKKNKGNRVSLNIGSLGRGAAKKAKYNIIQRLLCFCFVVEITLSQNLMLSGSHGIFHFNF